MYHIPIQLPETNPDYPTVYADKQYRVIVCRDSIQYIVQKSKGSQWHNRSYFMDWSNLRKQYNDLPLVDASPMLLSHEGHVRHAVSSMSLTSNQSMA